MTLKVDLDASVGESSTRRALVDISLAVAKCKKIVVVTGAGISCSCGIPDFRSSDGLYALVKQQYPDVVLKGRDLFDASLFRDPTSTSVFYTFISQLKRRIDTATPAPTHRFIKTLDTKQKLLRSYTQNIDGFEEKVGLRGSSWQEVKTSGKGKGKSKLKTGEIRNVQLHGDIHRARCTLCAFDVPCTEEYLCKFNRGEAPDCPECASRSQARVARSARPLKVGTLRPAIVLYDEAHPFGDDISSIQTHDISRKPDMLIIMGTSLKVHGLKKLVKDFAKAVHTTGATSTTGTPRSAKAWQGKVVFVNKTPPGSEWSDVIDYHVCGETDQWVEKVLDDWKKLRPSDWEVQQTLDVDGVFRVVKDSQPTVAAKTKSIGRRKSFAEKSHWDDETSSSLPPFKPTSSVPSSPVKRRQSACHYSEIDSSPRKRRDVPRVSTCLEGLEMEERRLLFQDTTNAASLLDNPSVGEPQVSKTSERRARVRTLSREVSTKVPRTQSVTRPSAQPRMWVEIKTT